MCEPFLPRKGNYRDLLVFKKAECIYTITFYFANTYLAKGDRTNGQMVQAARSGKQNIAEGAAAAATSAETEIKLTNVARASLQELLLDYEDYLKTRHLEIWDPNSEKAIQARNACAKHNDPEYYDQAIQVRSPETIANIAITLIHQNDLCLNNYIERLQKDFVANGGIKEQMYQARTNYRKNQPQNQTPG